MGFYSKETSKTLEGYLPYGKKYENFFNKSQKVIDISCGKDHIAAIISSVNDVTDSGTIYTWGLKEYGRLGYTSHSKNNYLKPHKVILDDKVSRICCGDDFTACLTIRGKLYTWGVNKNGFLGTEQISYNKDEIPIISKPTIVSSLSTKIIIQVVCGSNHMMCLTNERSVYSWGSGEYGVLGHGSTSGMNKPLLIKELFGKNIIFIAAGAFTSGAITGDGKLFLWGRGKYGVLGFGNEDDVLSPKQVTSFIEEELIFYVSLGFYHTIALSINLKTFAWGYSEGGRLGCISREDCDNKKHVNYPKEITSLRGMTISQVVAGDFHSIALESNIGKLIGWGQNIDYVLGVMDENITINPKELNVNKTIQKITGNISDLFEAYFSNVSLLNNLILSDNRKIKKLACGGSHTLCLTNNGIVYSWGFGPLGQLGLGFQTNDNKLSKVSSNFIQLLNQGETNQDKILNLVKDPMKIDFADKDTTIIKIYAGLNNSMAISTNHLVYIWGDNTYGQLCNKSSKTEKLKYSCSPLVIEELYGKEIIKGALGCDNCAVISSERKLYVWGANENMKLGINSKNQYECSAILINSLTNIIKISLGLHHSAAINEKNELFTWGHGFYGQLGLGNRATQGSPHKVDKLSVKYSKVKCGTYQTIALDKKNSIYIFGKGGLNLSSINDNKLYPESITEFKSSVINSIQIAGGTSYALNNESELYAWGDNYMNKVCCLQDTIITNHSMQIKFNFNIKCNIVKVFSGFYHSFILNELGEVYGWGNCDCYRLTSKYGQENQKEPKLLNIFDNLNRISLDNIEKGEEDNKDNKKQKRVIDERQIRMRLKTKTIPITFGEVCFIYENIDQRFTNNSLIEDDKTMLEQIESTCSFIDSINNTNLPNKKYIYIDRLLNYRFKELKVKANPNNTLSTFLINNMHEIEAIFTLIYIHPCCLCDYFEDKENGLSIKDLPIFIKGLFPLLNEIYTPFQRSLTNDCIIYLILFKIVLKKEILLLKENHFDLYSINDNKGSFIEHMLCFLFMNRYGVNVLYDILIDLFRLMIKEIAVIIQEKKNSVNLKKLIDKYNSIESFIGLNKKIGIDLLFIFIDSLMKNLEQNLGIVSNLLSICITKIKHKFKKVMKNEDNNKDKILLLLTKLFYKNLIANNLSTMFTDSYGERIIKVLLNEYIKNIDKHSPIENIKEDLMYIKALFKQFLHLISVFISYISCNADITEQIDEEKIDITNEDNINIIKKNTYNYHKQFKTFITDNLIKNKFELKKEIISSFISSNLSIKAKSIHIRTETLIQFLSIFPKLLNTRQNNRTLFLHNYKILSAPNSLVFSLSTMTPHQKEQHISFSLKNNYLYHPNKFYIDSYNKELQISKYSDISSITKLKRCKLCNLIMPGYFILNPDNRLNELIVTFKEKVKEEYMIPLTSILRKYPFSQDTIITSLSSFKTKLNQIYELVVKKYEEIEKESEENENEEIHKKEESNMNINEYNKERATQLKKHIEELKLVIFSLEEMLSKKEGNFSDKVKFENFILKLYSHLKLQYSHYTFISKLKKILLEFEDFKKTMIIKKDSSNKDITNSIVALRTMNYSLDKTKDEQYNILLSNGSNFNVNSLTHYRGHYNSSTDDIKRFSLITSKDRFKYRLLNYSFNALKNANIFYNCDQLIDNHKNLKENMIKIIIQKAHDTQFDIIIRNNKDENVETFVMTYDDYRRYYIDSSLMSSAYLGGIGAINITKFVKLLNTNMIRETEKDDNADDIDVFD